jgi:uncharacterized Zn finger protein (UPF0148 family)
MSRDKLICEKCGTALWWRDEYIGKRVRCPICGHISAVIVEAQTAREDETKEAKDAEKREKTEDDDLFND